MRFTDLSIQDQIDYACRQIIVHSIIYYDMNTNIITDKQYDAKMKYLGKLIKENQDILSQCYYYNCLKDFDPSTGFDLKYKLTDEHRKYLEHIAQNVINLYNSGY
jgi:hypothetical protein